MMQAGIITHQALREHLKPYGYAPENVTQGLWIHTDRDINFTLVVGDFGIKYTHKKMWTTSSQPCRKNIR